MLISWSLNQDFLSNIPIQTLHYFLTKLRLATISFIKVYGRFNQLEPLNMPQEQITNWAKRIPRNFINKIRIILFGNHIDYRKFANSF